MENISLRCQDCGQAVTLGRRPADDVVKCPACDARIAVPPPGQADDAAGGYAVDLGKTCPACGREMPPKGVFCVQCGYHQKTGKTVRTAIRVEPIDRTWTFGLIPLGFFATLRVRRDEDGSGWATHTQHLVYLPVIKTEVDLRECHEVWLSYREGFDVLGWMIFVMLLFLCGVPGILFWWFTYSASTYSLDLPRRRGRW